ncbi:MAG: hypothetical protein HOD72_06275 [Opitutae bacterium]|nr:hypothetical protein [Opitutae bacterium]MBT5691714.1 hypothetical protein [Opitutae bacterium]MBT6462990.1 hypothetical protein [Opitutae bacterium]MBT6957819.1 hypothetical protein [Opitutae bacterium]MBT7854494.1 hypothetical protein [Opitutae bacterium]
MKKEDLEVLIEKYLDDDLHEDESNRLESLLIESGEARQTFWERTEIHGLTRETLLQGQAEEGLPGKTSSRKVINFPWAWSSAACLAVGLLITLADKDKTVTDKTNTKSETKLNPNTYLARVGFQSNELVQSGIFEKKQFIKSGELAIGKGLLELNLFNKVTLLLQGPAKVNLQSLDQMVLHHGQLSAEVPEGARGFKVHTPAGEVIDLGTRFGISANLDGHMETHVFEGEVDVIEPNALHKLKTNQALRLDPMSVENIVSEPTRFPALRTIYEQPLAQPGFEGNTLVEFGGIPDRTGIWRGDRALVTRADQGIHPYDGEFMLKFEQTYPESEVFDPLSNTSQSLQQQTIDIRNLRKKYPMTRLVAEADAFFNRVQGGPETDTQFSVAILACTGDMKKLPSLNGNINSHRRASVENSLESDSDPSTWERLGAKLNIPKKASFLILRIAAHENIQNDPQESKELDGHYVDGVGLKIHRGPIPGNN